MSTAPLVWTLLFLLLSAALLLLPFYPAWREWRHPVDARRLELPDARPSAGLPLPVPVPAHLELTPDTDSADELSASESIRVPAGRRFGRLRAPTIWLGHERVGPSTPPPVHHAALGQPARSRHWGSEGWRVSGDCHIPDAHQLQGALVVTGSLHIGQDCLIRGDIKAHGPVHIGRRSQIEGALFGTQAITLDEGVQVLGPVVSETSVSLGPQVRIGRLDHPGLLIAPEVVAHSGAVVHGGVWAKARGRVT